MDGQFPNERRRLGGGFRRLRTDGGSCQRVACLEQDEIRLGRDDGPSRAPDASGVSAASRGPFYFAWGCFRDFVSGPCGVPPKSICTASGTRDRWLRADGEFDSNPSRSSGATPQSHFGAKPKSVSRPPALPMPEI